MAGTATDETTQAVRKGGFVACGVIAMEYKLMPLNLKDVDSKKGVVTGYASTFGVMDEGRDIVESGAFKRTINAWGPEGKGRIKALYMHEPAWMVGRPVVLKEDEIGLYHETQFSVRNTLAKDVLVLIEDGVITEQSIGYDTVVAEVDKDRNARLLKELKLYEYSFVAWGMNEFTPITGVKSGLPPADQLAKSMERMEQALRSGHFESDEIPQMMELAIKRWRDELREIKTTERRERPVSVTTQRKAPDFNQIVQAGDLRQRFWRLFDALYEAVWGILEDEDETDKATAIGASVEQFRNAIMAWVNQAVATNLFDDKAEMKALKQVWTPLSKLVDPTKVTPQSGDPANSDPASPVKDHLPDEIKEILSSVRSLSGYGAHKALERELRAFGAELRRKGAG